jgi:hypothetical protein
MKFLFLRKHYPKKMTKAETEKHLLFLIDLEMQYFPCDGGDELVAEIDVGQNDDKLNF